MYPTFSIVCPAKVSIEEISGWMSARNISNSLMNVPSGDILAIFVGRKQAIIIEISPDPKNFTALLHE